MPGAAPTAGRKEPPPVSLFCYRMSGLLTDEIVVGSQGCLCLFQIACKSSVGVPVPDGLCRIAGQAAGRAHQIHREPGLFLPSDGAGPAFLHELLGVLPVPRRDELDNGHDDCRRSRDYLSPHDDPSLRIDGDADGQILRFIRLRIGSEQVLVHLTPADEATYRFLLNELRSKHRKGYRSVRCMVPGRQKPLIRCPDTNKCSDCPYGRKPEDRDPNEISWDGLIEAGTEPKITDHTTPQAETELMYKELLDLMAREDPDIAKAYNWREHLGFDVKEIANKLQLSDRQVRYLLQKAETIRVKYINA